ncbi:glycosyltransferase family 2 protein [Mucilaginibacter sp.]|uniref:glycosyltransferase family 2 protein n=1 Tax=Mucilaginibacter sp. TaxID=1882438 RepID=UPI003263E3AE
MASPLVSIIIPAYNAESYLEATIQSAVAQTWPNKEIIVVDDGSNDNTLRIAKELEGELVSVYAQPNSGASTARNYGLSKSKGSFIQFLDADDLLSPGKIEQQTTALITQPNKVAVCSTIHFFDDAARLTSTPSPYEEQFIYSTNNPVDFMVRMWGGYDLKASMVQSNAWLIPKTLIDKFGNWNENLTLDDDGEFFARMALNSAGIIKTGGLNYYRKFRTLKNLSAQKHTAAMASAVLSATLKKQHLFAKTDSDEAQKAIFKQFTDLSLRCYIEEPDLYQQVMAELKALPQYQYKPILGGAAINFIANTLGWRTAKKMQLTYNQITRSS